MAEVEEGTKGSKESEPAAENPEPDVEEKVASNGPQFTMEGCCILRGFLFSN